MSASNVGTEAVSGASGSCSIAIAGPVSARVRGGPLYGERVENGTAGSMAHKGRRRRASDISKETARILFLAYGRDAVQMAELRCAELKASGDKEGLSNWKE